jgi:quercetin dioxygenase-like cupin family protein
MTFSVTHWSGDPPDESTIRHRMEAEGLNPYLWSNAPADRYAPHRHGYDKVIYVVSGSIRFGLPELDESVELEPGDRLDLPAGILHDAIVGEEGVRCLEGHHQA